MRKIGNMLSVAIATATLALVGLAATDTAQAATALPAGQHAAQRPLDDSHFTAGSTLYRNGAWTSGNGRAVLRLQQDGNLVLYKDGRPAWQADGAWPSGSRAVLQSDGNFVVYDTSGRPLWASGTWGHPGAYLAVQDDGNVVVYTVYGTPIWATDTGD